jgi:ParB family chromosome partitioning protein
MIDSRLELAADITGLHGAEYNPRKIGQSDREALQESITTLGCVKPIIAVKSTGLIVAGHQRTNALRANGITHAPVFWLTKVNDHDAARFNQLHNGTDMDNGDEGASFPGGFDSLGMQVADSGRLQANWRASGADLRNAIARLIKLHGPWGACVATQSGEVVHCAQYAIASALSLDPLTVFVIEDERAEEYRSRLSRAYGVFSYDHIKRKSYVQSEAQMTRMSEKRLNRSGLWEQHLQPWLKDNPTARVLDFGCGRGEYARDAIKKGFNVTMLEFYPRKDGGSCCGSQRLVDVARANSMVTETLAQFKASGPFDAVICDSVMNSVDSIQTEAHVLNTLNVLTKMGGTLFISGRSFGEVEKGGKRKSASTGQGGVRLTYLDENGLTAVLRDGAWFFQRFHKPEQIAELMDRHGFRVDAIQDASSGSWRRRVTKIAEPSHEDTRAALAHEFDMPLNDTGRTLGRASDAISVILP